MFGFSSSGHAQPSHGAQTLEQIRKTRQAVVALQYAQRTSQRRETPGVGELSVPHGLTDSGNNTSLLLHTGLLLPQGVGGTPTVMSAQIVLEYAPWHAIVAPFLGVGAGGYLVMGRGTGRPDAPRVEWLWGSSLGAGLAFDWGRWLALPMSMRALGQLFWAEQSVVQLDVVYSGWSLGVGVEYRFDVPKIGVVRQVTHGEDAPEGW